MFKQPKVVPINVVKRDSKEQLKKGTVFSIRAGTVTCLPIRHMLAAAHRHGMRAPQNPDWSARRRGKILFMPKRSCDDSCKT
jgi:hypothetical protein